MAEVSAQASAWSRAQWGTAALGDRRRTERAVEVGASLAAGAGGSLPQCLSGWPALKATYRLLACPAVTHEALSAPHRQATRQAGEQSSGPVLFVQDTTQLDYTHHQGTRGLGCIGRGCWQQGLVVHTTLAVEAGTAGAAVLGMADQRVWRREGTGKRHQPRAERLGRPKESDVWGDSLERIGPAPAGCCWVSVGDRESDVFEHLERARALGWHCVVQARHNRTLKECADGLLERIRAQPARTQRTSLLSARAGGRPVREHRLEVAWMAVHMPRPAHRPAGPGLNVWVVRAWNAMVEWVLLSTVPVEDGAKANTVLDWYRCRWLIEEYHKGLKTGCRIEALALSTAERLEAALGILAIVAVRLLQLRGQARSTPDELALKCIDPLWLKLISRRFSLNQHTLTLRHFWHAVARLGGFIGRKADGEPGWQTLWLGFQRLQDMAWAAAYPPDT